MGYITPANPKIRLEQASGRATCRKCQKRINKDEWEIIMNGGTGNYDGHFHFFKCFLPSNTEVLKRIITLGFGDYESGFNILMEYWDSLPDEDKPEIHEKLTELGL